MNPETTIHPLIIYGMSAVISIISVLIAVIWGIIRKEAEMNANAIAQKASSDSLKELRQAQTEALAGVKHHFHAQLDKQHSDYHDRLKELTLKQDREIDWLKDEMGKISDNINELRKESNKAQQEMMKQLQEVAIMLNRRPN